LGVIGIHQMEQRKVGVTAYAGYRSGERPRSFVLEGKKINVVEIISRWVEEAAEDRRQKRFFRVKGDDGFTHVLSHIEQTGEWFLE
jgi:hypothetical protein